MTDGGRDKCLIIVEKNAFSVISNCESGGKVTFSSPFEPNAFDLIILSDFEKLTLLRLHSENAPYYIFSSRELGANLRVWRLLLKAKASFDIVMTEAGIVTETRLEKTKQNILMCS